MKAVALLTLKPYGQIKPHPDITMQFCNFTFRTRPESGHQMQSNAAPPRISDCKRGAKCSRVKSFLHRLPHRFPRFCSNRRQMELTSSSSGTPSFLLNAIQPSRFSLKNRLSGNCFLLVSKMIFFLREAAKKKTFFLGDLSQICLPTHPPRDFCEIWENER